MGTMSEAAQDRIDDLLADLVQANRDKAEMLPWLVKCQWGDEGACPECGNVPGPTVNHAANCRLDALLHRVRLEEDDPVRDSAPEMLTLLRSGEWGYNSEAGCPWCSRLAEDNEHTYDCRLAALLKRLGE
jgi:hypothetical protein